MDDLLREFLTESGESIAQLDTDLVRLEQNPEDPGLLSNIFRLVHTIKGTCGFLGLPRLEGVAHAGENVLGKIRDGELPVTPAAITVVLESLDRIKELLATLEATESEPAGEDSDLIGRLNAVANGTAAAAPAPAPVADQAPEAVAAPVAEPVPAGVSIYEQFGGEGGVAWSVAALLQLSKDDAAFAAKAEQIDAIQLRKVFGAFVTAVLDRTAEADFAGWRARFDALGVADMLTSVFMPRVKPAIADLGPPPVVAIQAATLLESALSRTASGTVPAAKPAKAEEAKAPAAVAPQPQAKPAAAPKPATAQPEDSETSLSKQSIRVGVDVLEGLMTLVGELVLTRNQLLQMLRKLDNSDFATPLQRLNHITSELQEGVMKTRMQPIGNAWSKLPRIVRDLSKELSKKIDLEMRGADTELDRQVLEMIRDPLTHMVRNSADHGIETPKVRSDAGKPENGQIILNAFHEGGHIIIEIKDDGRGLPVEKLRRKMVDYGLVNEAEAAEMSDQRIQHFIFHPGLSTAEKVTSVSGRGVGMDVVRTNIEKIGGTIDLKSVEGSGTSFTIKIPLTLAIVSALIVESAGEKFAIPQISVVELVRAGGTSEHRIEGISGTPVLRLRNRLLPLISLSKALNLDTKADATPETNELFVVVSQVGNQLFGIIVDRVFDTEEIVVKPVSPILRHISMFSGNTILGDGSVIMILDPNGIAASVGELESENTATGGAVAQLKSRGGEANEAVAMLVFRAGGDDPKAVPLSLIARLEEVEAGSIEQSDGRYVLQYRGQLMPLVPYRAGMTPRSEGRQAILVFAEGDRRMGLLVDEIVDIVDERLDVQIGGENVGTLGSAVIAGKATDVIDAGYFLRQAHEDWFSPSRSTQSGASDAGRRVLLVDDSPFFRNLMSPLLSAAGYRVTTAEDGSHALRLMEESGDFDIIVSDIDMPNMTGFEFAEACRQSERWRETPMLALSAMRDPSAKERGRAVGFNDYVVKFDRDNLLQAMSQALAAGGRR